MDLSELNRSRGGVDVVVSGDRRVHSKRTRVTRSSFDCDVNDGSPECLIEEKSFPESPVAKGNMACDEISRCDLEARTDSGVNVDRKSVRKSSDVVDDTNAGQTMKKSGRKKPNALQKRTPRRFPLTINELFNTGLLEGLPVVYDGRKGEPILQGIIKEGGILCSCEECKGCRVILPTHFELHACKVRRHATQYIFLENGKSLRQILEICKMKSNDTLEAIIQNAIGSSKNPSSFDDSKNVSGHPHLAQTIPDGDGYDIPLHVSRARTDILICYSRTRPKAVGCLLSHSQAKSNLSKPPLSCSPINSKKPASNLNEKKRKRGRPIKSRTSKPPSKPSKSLTSEPSKSSCSKTYSNSLKNTYLKCKNEWKITRKHNRLHKLVFEGNGLPDGTELAYYARGKKLLKGYKKGYGIFCFCCSSEVSPTLFESHAGCASRRKPYQFIYTSNGVSLHELALSLLKGRRFAPKESDDYCIICLDGGNLIICDGCPRVFHKECASLRSVPSGDWYCRYCKNMFKREKFVAHNVNALDAGRISGVDPIEQITRRIVQNEDFETSACALCRGGDFSSSGFGPLTVMLCDQCQKGFHVGCLREHGMQILKELPKENWFCDIDCETVYFALQKLTTNGSEEVPNYILNSVNKKQDENHFDAKKYEVRYQLISGKIATLETRRLLAKAVSIFHDCFEPIVDITTGKDLIPSMVYGRNMGLHEFFGMHCAILMVNSVVVSTGIIRIFNSEVAELPLVATAKDSQGKGYFHALLSCIQRMLVSINVRSFILPAAEETESKWREKFGFQKMSSEQFVDYERRYYQMMVFNRTSMLQKRLMES